MRAGAGALVAVGLAGSLVVASAAATHAAQRKTVSCQKNTEDGRILADGRQVGDVRYRVLRYDMMRDEGLWTYGRCLIEFR